MSYPNYTKDQMIVEIEKEIENLRKVNLQLERVTFTNYVGQSCSFYPGTCRIDTPDKKSLTLEQFWEEYNGLGTLLKTLKDYRMILSKI